MSMDNQHVSARAPFGLFGAAFEYMMDATQRSVLFWDVMRQRSSQYSDHLAEKVPHVLDYAAELVMDGRTLKRPVNYLLVRIVPPDGIEIDPSRRPFVVVDPRAGHGPGIGGFKADSEVGVAMKAGHTCYFIGFTPDPMPGQTIEDIARAEATFLEKVIALHPEADGKPCVIGNCQAGWAVIILAAIRPELFGPIILAGAPLSYWAGVRGQNPMRYSGGLLGGSWLTALTSDMGGGKFDGGNLSPILKTRTRPTHCGPSNITSTQRSTPKPNATSSSSAGGAATSTSMPKKSSSSSTNCLSATSLRRGSSPPRTAWQSTFVTSARRSWCSARRATTSRRPSRRSTGSSIYMTMSTRSGRSDRPLSIRYTKPSAISESSSRAGSQRRSTTSSPATLI